jgi:hypothetical protein
LNLKIILNLYAVCLVKNRNIRKNGWLFNAVSDQIIYSVSLSLRGDGFKPNFSLMPRLLNPWFLVFVWKLFVEKYFKLISKLQMRNIFDLE